MSEKLHTPKLANCYGTTLCTFVKRSKSTARGTEAGIHLVGYTLMYSLKVESYWEVWGKSVRPHFCHSLVRVEWRQHTNSGKDTIDNLMARGAKHTCGAAAGVWVISRLTWLFDKKNHTCIFSGRSCATSTITVLNKCRCVKVASAQ